MARVTRSLSALWRLAAAFCLSLTFACSDPVGTTDHTSPPIDDEFDAGSGIVAQTPTPVQIQNLALLGKAWGFAKYHHPAVVRGYNNWDYELFRAVPAVLAAPDRASAADAIVSWLDSLGVIAACGPCVQAPSRTHLFPDNSWIADTADVGADLSGRLLTMHRNRRIEGVHRYVSFAPNVGNPVFSEEAPYANHASPDAGYRLLALFRFWNIIEYWFPYRDVMEEDWDAVLSELNSLKTASQSSSITSL